ncbi:MAG: hypothetical protein H7329_09220 [Opitutaceae bacterium]|nr:hypothetical protein [Cytophagales bacterium]
MDLKQALYAEHSKQQTDQIIFWIGSNPGRFAKLMEVFFSDDQVLAQRSAWAVGLIGRKYPNMFYPFLEQSINQLQHTNNHDAVIRNILRVIQDIQVPEHLEGILVELCIAYVVNPKAPGAIKAFSISTLENISSKYPELVREILHILKERIDNETPAFISRAKRFIIRYSKNTK